MNQALKKISNDKRRDLRRAGVILFCKQTGDEPIFSYECLRSGQIHYCLDVSRNQENLSKVIFTDLSKKQTVELLEQSKKIVSVKALQHRFVLNWGQCPELVGEVRKACALFDDIKMPKLISGNGHPTHHLRDIRKAVQCAAMARLRMNF